MIERYALPVAAFAVVIEDGKMLLLKRQNSGYRDGFYTLPSGHLDKGETVKEAIVRELAEETGLMTTLDDVDVVHVSHTIDNREYLLFFGRINAWSGIMQNMEPEKCAELAWFPLHDLPENTIVYIRDILVLIERGEYYSNFGWNR
jgi:8-oxo-dGTP diphosphatase